MILQPVAASAGGKVTPTGGTKAPNVGAAPNGIPLIDIVKPNAKGLSHNQYKDFNVDKPGVILNNDNKETGKSKLGGVTPGNPNLANSGPAKVILNEVTSNNRSALDGPIEVFGGRADVIVANPNGITCNGCGFINTPRATLTTGVPDIGGDGRLTGFIVNRGDITFGSKGGNFAAGDGAVDLFDVVSRTVHVDGPVYGKNVRLTAGRNKYSYADGTATALAATSGTPEFAIDGSALGAMQADSIKIVVTEKGAGVRMSGKMAANVGQLSLSADGKISIGNASGRDGLTIKSNAKVQARKLASKKKVVVKAGKGVTLESVAADGDVTLSSGASLLSIAGAVTSLGSVELSSNAGITTGDVDAGDAVRLTASSGNIASSGRVRAGRGDLTLSAAGAISAGSLVSFGNMGLTAGLDLNVTGDLFAHGDVTVVAKSIKAATIASGVDIAATSASPSGAIALSAAGDMKLTASAGSITASALLSAGSQNVAAANLIAGNVTSHGNITIRAATDVSGQVLGAGDVSVDGASIKSGAVVSGVDFASTDTSSGNVVLSDTGNLTLVARSGDMTAGTLLSAGDLIVTAKQNLKANAVSHHNLTMTAGGTIALTGQSLVAGDATLEAKAITTGMLVSGVDFAATAASPTGDLMVRQTGKMSLDATEGSITADEFLSGGDLSAHATADITYNSLQSFGSAFLDADQGSISIHKATKAAGNITLTTKSVDLSNGRGKLATAQTLIINAQTADFSGSTLTFGGMQVALTGTADLSGARLRAVTSDGGSGDIIIKAASLDMTSATALMAARDLTLTLPSLVNAGQIAAGHDLTLNLTGDFTNGSTGLAYAGNDGRLHVAGDLVNDRGAIMAGHDLTIAANASGAKNNSITNISGLIRAENDITIATKELTNKRLTTPTWSTVLVSSGVAAGFELNPDAAGLPFAYIRDSGEYSIYPGQPTSYWADYEPLLFSVATLADGTSYHAWTWISGDGPHGVHDIVNWIKDRIPLDGNGDPILDANNPPRYFIVEYQTSGDDPSTTYDWDEASNISQTVYEERFNGTLSPQALIHAGGNLAINATVLNNSYSSIEAEGNATLKGSVLNNEGVTLTKTVTTTCNAQGACEAYDEDGNRDPSKDIAQGTSILTSVQVADSSAAGNIKAGGNLNIAGYATVNNTSAPGSIAGSANVAPASGPGNPTDALNGLTAAAALFTPNSALSGLTSNEIVAAIANSRPKPNSGGFGGTVPGQRFLYETRAAFLDVGKFYGSGYFIDRIGYEPDRKIPFLGDAYFENQLIDQQLRQELGHGLGDDPVEQVKSLLDAGIEFANANGLTFGQPLTKAQIAGLKTSMVWYETQTVQGVEVLVPVVYVAKADKANAAVAGALISGGTVTVDAGKINNSGAFAASSDLHVSGTTIKANGGSFVSGGNVTVAASGDLTLTAQTLAVGGQNVVNPNAMVDAGGNATLSAGNKLTLQGAAVEAAGDATLKGKSVTMDVVKVENGGSQNATGSSVTTGGSATIKATNDVNIIGSSADAGTSLSVESTKGSVNVVSAGVTRKTNDGYSKITTTAQQGSQLSSGNGTTVTAKNDILLSGSSVDAGGDVALQAGNDVNISAAQNTMSSEFGNNSAGSTTHSGSSITAKGAISVTAGADGKGNLNIIGSEVAADKTTTLSAADDVVIAEARDSWSLHSEYEKEGSGWFSSDSKYETDKTIGTAKGSSIKGGEGVSIKSGGDTLISASGIQAGNDDPKNKAGISIDVGGNLLIASGKNSVSHDRRSEKDGFLSSSSGRAQIYDERVVGSQLSASGNVNLNAGGAAVIMGSTVGAGGSISATGDSVSVIGAQEVHTYNSKSEESGLFSGSTDGFFSIWGKEKDKLSGSSINNVGSLLTAGEDVILSARDTDVNIIGSAVGAGNDIVLLANRDVNILPGKESATSKESHENSGFGISYGAGNGSLSLGIGVNSTTDKISQGSSTNAMSTLSAGNDLVINAGRDANLQAADVSAEHDVAILATRNVNLLAANDVTNYKAVHEQMFVGVTATVSSGLISAAQSIGDAADQAAKGSDTYSAAHAAFAGFQAYQAIKAATAEEGGGLGALGSASLSAGFSFSKSESSVATSTPVVTTIRGGNSVTIEAKSGSITGHGTQILAGVNALGLPVLSDDPSAGDITLTAGKDITLTSAQAVTQMSGDSTSGGASIGVSTGSGVNVSVNGGKGSTGETVVTHVNSHVIGTGNVTIKSGKDTTLAGAVVKGQSVKADVGGDLSIITQQDTANYDETSTSGSFSAGTGGVGGGVTQGTTTGSYVNTGEQSGFIAGAGGFDIKVKDHIEIVGGVIVSDAPKDKNSIEADSMSVKNLDNKMSAETGSLGVALTPSGLPVPVVGQPAFDEDKGKTLTTISPATVTLHDQDGDGVKDTAKDKAATTALLSTVNTDPDKANVQVDMYDIEDLKDKQQVAAMVSQMLNFAIGEISVKAGFAEGSPEKIALHAVAGAITAMISGGDVGLAALAGGGSEAVNALLVKALEKYPNLKPDQRAAVLQWGAALAGAAIGRTLGAATGLDNVNFNYLNHEQGEDFKREMKECGDDAECKRTVASLYEELSLENDIAYSNCENEQCRAKHRAAMDGAHDLLRDLSPINAVEPEYVSYLFALQQESRKSQIEEISRQREAALNEAIQYCAGKSGDPGCVNRVKVERFESLVTRNGLRAIISSLGFTYFQGRLRPTGGAGEEAGPTNSGPNLTIRDHYDNHKAVVKDVKSQLTDLGYRVSDKEISFGSSCGTGRCRPDIVYERPDGTIGIIEIKTGAADLTIRQSEIYPQIRDGNAIPRGQVAKDFDLKPGVPLKDQGYPNGIPVYEVKFPGAGE